MALETVLEKTRRIENEYNLVAREKGTGSGIQIDVDELVARDGRAYIFVDYLFDSGSGLFGVTGTRMVPVTQEEVDRRMEQLRDPEWSHLYYIYQEQVENGLDESWSSWIDRQINLEGIELVLDPSYVTKYGETVKDNEESETGERPEYVECTGGGRMFDSDMSVGDYDVVYNHALFELVKRVERSGLGLSEE